MGASGTGAGAPMLSVEDLWLGTGTGTGGNSGLAELALEQKESNVELVDHHYYLAVIMHAVLTFGMKQCKPMGLFDTKVRQHCRSREKNSEGSCYNQGIINMAYCLL